MPPPSREARRWASGVGSALAVVLALTVLAVWAPAAAGARPASLSSVAQEPSQPGQPPAPTTSPDDVRQTADDVLARPEFQRPEPNVFDKARDWIGERIGRLLQSLTSGSGASLLGWGVMLLAIAAIVFLLARFGRTVQRDPRRAAEVSVERARTSAQWLDEAERLERDGEWKLALRARFRALVADLVEHDVVVDVPGRTAGEYRAEVADNLPQVADAFAGASYLFEDAWYGNEPTGEDENRRFRDLAGRVAEVAAARRPPATEDAMVEAVSA